MYTKPVDLGMVYHMFGWGLQEVIWSPWLESSCSNQQPVDTSRGFLINVDKSII